MATSRDMSQRSIWLVIALIIAALGTMIVSFGFRTPKAEETGRFESKQAANEALAALEERYTHLREQKRYQPVIDAATELLHRFDQHLPLHNFLAMVLSEAGRLEAAYDRLSVSLGIHPRQADRQFMAGVLATKLGRLDPALEHFRLAVNLDRQNASYRVHQAMAHFELQQPDQARMLLLQALQLDSNLAEAYYGLGELDFADNKLSLALQQIDKAISRTPLAKRETQVKYIRKKAWILRRSNRWSDALATLRQLTANERMDPAVVKEMAVLWDLLEKPVQSARLFEEGLVRDPTNWSFAAAAAGHRIDTGDLDLARQHLRTLKELKPRAAEIQVLEAKLRAFVPR